MKITKINVKGMHCVSCEILIQKSIETINWAQVESISASKWTIDINISNERILPLIHKQIQNAWYEVLDSEQVDTTKNVNIKYLWISIAIVSILALLFYKLDVVQYLPSTAGNNVWLWVALLMWIIASVSTCLAIVGSVVIGFSEYVDASKWTWHRIKTQLSFHVGRIWWFFLLWWILWLVGKAIAISLTATTVMTIFVWIVVLRMWLHLLNILPNITSLWFHLPKSRSNKTLTTKNPVFAPLIGALTFFLPCGFTLSMQLIAVNSGNFWQWWLVMAIFALGTLPVLFAVWLWSAYVKEKKMKLLHSIIWTLIVFFGIFMVMNGRRILGWLSFFTNNNNNIIDTNAVYEKVNIWHNWLNLVPEVVTLTAGKNYELIITPSDNGKWCMVSLTMPGLDRSVNPIIKDQPIVYKFTNIKAGKYDVVCGTMWMYQGQILVQ